MLEQLNFLAGIALMLYGIHTLRRGTERLFGSRLRNLLQTATRSNLRGLGAGFLLSILTPSSTAVSLLSVEAINSGFVTFQQVLAVMLGANIGFTVTVQLLAFKFYLWNAVFVAVGAPLFLFARRQHLKGLGESLLGIGFLLLSIQILTLAVAPLRDNSDIREMMRILASHPVWLVSFATVLELILQSATAAIGIGLALCGEGILPVNGAVAVVIGANIGIAVTALAAGFSRVDTRRMAIGNLLFKLVGAVVCVPLLPSLVDALRPLSPAGDTQVVANAHTLFNVALALVFLPLVPFVARRLERLVPARPTGEEEGRFGPQYLDMASLGSPALALGQATREILRMADIVREMLRKAHRAFVENNAALCEEVQQQDDKVCLLNAEIKAYITRLREQALNPEESRREMALLSFAYELETVGDIIDKNLIDLAKKKITLGVKFSKEGWAELDEFFGKVQENFEIAVSAFASRDQLLATELLRHKHQIHESEIELRARHFHRLHAGLAESIETSAIHLDVLTNLKSINSHIAAVAHPILEVKAS